MVRPKYEPTRKRPTTYSIPPSKRRRREDEYKSTYGKVSYARAPLRRRFIPEICPRTTLTKLSQSGRFSIDCGAAGAMGFHEFAANGVFQPDITGAGGSCAGLDQWGNLYRYYTVVSSRIRIQGVTNCANPMIGMLRCDIKAIAAPIVTLFDLQANSHAGELRVFGANASNVTGTYYIFRLWRLNIYYRN